MPRPSSTSRIAAIEMDVEAIARRIASIELRLDQLADKIAHVSHLIDNLLTRQTEDEVWKRKTGRSLDAAWVELREIRDAAAEIERELKIK